MQLHRDVLEIAPYSLSLSHLDCESLNVVYGFDFTYRGNHNQLLAETLGLPPSLDSFLDIPGAQCMGYEPCIQLTLDAEMRTQCRLSFETRSIPYSMRTGDFPEEQLSVYLAVRRVDSLLPSEKFEGELQRLANLGKKTSWTITCSTISCDRSTKLSQFSSCSSFHHQPARASVRL